MTKKKPSSAAENNTTDEEAPALGYLWEKGTVPLELIFDQQDEKAQFQAAIDFHKANRKKLLKDYEGKFIAIIGDKVVDSAEVFGELALRVYLRFGYRDIFMPKVERKPRTVRVPSPRLRA